MSSASPVDETLLTPLTYRTNTRLQPFPLFTDPRLTEESIPDC